MYSRNAAAFVPAVEEATALLRHRGPDGSGLGVYAGAVLSMRRLAIIDLETGDQPMANETEAVHAVVNGEIYNYVELAQEQRKRGHQFRSSSDVETVVHAYEDHGRRFACSLRGMFAAAVYDESKRELLLARDPFGQKPLYYAETPGGGLVFASELKAMHPLLSYAGVTPSLNDQAVYHYLSLNFVPQPLTIFNEVHSVMPGEVLVVTPDGVRHETYWIQSVSASTEMDYEDALRLTRESISESVRLCLRSDVPVGAFLSGGLDSSIIVLEAVRAGASGMTTFSVAMDDASLDESPIARRTADALGVENVVVPVKVEPLADLEAVVDAYDQPYADSSAIATFAVSRATSRHRKVVLTGDGGDEIFGGYRRHIAAYASARVPRPIARLAGRSLTPVALAVASSQRRRSSLGFLARWLQGLGLDDPERYLKWTQDRLRERDKKRLVMDRQRSTEDLVSDIIGDESDWLEQQFRVDTRLTLPGDMLVKMDIATSAWSLEARSPLLDHVLAERVGTIPRRWLFKGWRTKALLRDAYASELRPEVVVGAKRGFEIPVGRWLAREWRPLVEDLVLDPSARIGQYLPSDLVAGIYQDQEFNDRNLPSLRYGLLVLEMWLRRHGAS